MASSWPGSHNYIPFDAIELDWVKLSEMFDDDKGTNDCMLVAVPWKAISLLVSTLRFSEYWHLWGLPSDEAKWTESQQQTWYEISAFVAELEVCLMSGCSVSDLIKTNRMLVAAITGESDDLTDPLPASVDYAGVSVSDRLKDVYDKLGTLDLTVSTGLAAIKDAVDAQTDPETIGDDLENIKLAIEAIAVVAAL